MGRPIRRRLSPETRRLELIEAAERLLQTHGGRVRVEDVVREAGVAKGTFFLYFPTWDDLLEAVRQRLVEAFDAAHPLPIEGGGPVDWRRVVEGHASAFVDFAVARHGIGEVVFHSDFSERRPLADNAVVRLAAVIRAGQAEGAIASVDPDAAARLLYAVIHAAADAVAAGFDRSVMLETMRDLLNRALDPQRKDGGRS